MVIKKQAKNAMDDFINNATTNGEQTGTTSEVVPNQNQAKTEKVKGTTKKTNKKLLLDADECASFTTPINLYELCALRYLAKEDERSMRKMARRLWAKFIVEEANREGFNQEKAVELLEDKEMGYNEQFTK